MGKRWVQCCGGHPGKLLQLSHASAVAWNARQRPDYFHVRRLAPSPQQQQQHYLHPAWVGSPGGGGGGSKIL